MLTLMISFFLKNFGLSMLCLALIIICLQQTFSQKSLAENIYQWIALLPIGITAIYAFILHAFFPNLAAKTIGWLNSPFQYEVAVANLGFGLLAIFSFKLKQGFRLATVLGVTCWLWGDAVGHVIQMVTHHNYSVGNAGSWFWLDVSMPMVLILSLWRLANVSSNKWA